ncbi:hypothetical protein CAAN4_C06700 [[Candida] anglica]|uniref:DUF4045 domain-containing protein n=1 Tax=[Candida] anglica TaxID=148631 RepID=A0ABP0EAX1_9ASCO
MVNFFSNKRKTDRQGFNRYAEELNRYQQNSVAGVPNSGMTRSDSLSNGAGQAAMAALRIHQQPKSPPVQQSYQQRQLPHTPQSRSNSITSRSSSVHNNISRSNSLRTYVYHPKASYVAGQPLSSEQLSANAAANAHAAMNGGNKRLNSLSSNTSSVRRTNSLTNRTNSLTKRSNSLTSQEYRPPAFHSQHSPNKGSPVKPPVVYEEMDELDEDPDLSHGVITSTKTTKIVDSSGRTTSITIETIKTLPDGSNIIETKTKTRPTSKPNSRSNSLTAPPVLNQGFRSSSMTSQQGSAYNLTKIDEDLHDFDYDFTQPNHQQTSPIQLERSPLRPLPIENGGSRGSTEAQPPLRSILKNSAKNLEKIQTQYADDTTTKSPAVAAAAAAAAAGGSARGSAPSSPGRSDQETIRSNRTDEDEDFADALDTFGNKSGNRRSFIDVGQPNLVNKRSHPYKELDKKKPSPLGAEPTIASSSGYKPTSPTIDENIPVFTTPMTLQPSPVLTTSKKFQEAPQLNGSVNKDSRPPVTSTNDPSPPQNSSGGSIKFLDTVEEIPNKPIKPIRLTEEEMYERALEAARVKVYGDSYSSSPERSLSPTVRSTSSPKPGLVSGSPAGVSPVNGTKNGGRTMSITSNLSSLLDEARKNKKPVQIGNNHSAHLNHYEMNVNGIKDDYHYQNHHRDFTRHSLRGDSSSSESMSLGAAIVSPPRRKDRAKEEKKLAKLKREEEKSAKKQADLAKKQAAKDKKSSGLTGGSRISSLFGLKKKTSFVGIIDSDSWQERENEEKQRIETERRMEEDHILNDQQEQFQAETQFHQQQLMNESDKPSDMYQYRTLDTRSVPTIEESEFESESNEVSKSLQPVNKTESNPKSSSNVVPLPEPTIKETTVPHGSRSPVVPLIVTSGVSESVDKFPEPTIEEKSLVGSPTADWSPPVDTSTPEIKLTDHDNQDVDAKRLEPSIKLPNDILTDIEEPDTMAAYAAYADNSPLKSNSPVHDFDTVVKQDTMSNGVTQDVEEVESLGEFDEESSIREYSPEEEARLEEIVKEPSSSRRSSVADIASMSGSIAEKIEGKKDNEDNSALDEFTKKLRAAVQTVGTDADSVGSVDPDETFDSELNLDSRRTSPGELKEVLGRSFDGNERNVNGSNSSYNGKEVSVNGGTPSQKTKANDIHDNFPPPPPEKLFQEPPRFTNGAFQEPGTPRTSSQSHRNGSLPFMDSPESGIRSHFSRLSTNNKEVVIETNHTPGSSPRKGKMKKKILKLFVNSYDHQ